MAFLENHKKFSRCSEFFSTQIFFHGWPLEHHYGARCKDVWPPQWWPGKAKPGVLLIYLDIRTVMLQFSHQDYTMLLGNLEWLSSYSNWKLPWLSSYSYGSYPEVLYCTSFLYSAQYLHVLQDSKCYLTHPTEQSTVQGLK